MMRCNKQQLIQTYSLILSSTEDKFNKTNNVDDNQKHEEKKELTEA